MACLPINEQTKRHVGAGAELTGCVGPRQKGKHQLDIKEADEHLVEEGAQSH